MIPMMLQLCANRLLSKTVTHGMISFLAIILPNSIIELDSDPISDVFGHSVLCNGMMSQGVDHQSVVRPTLFLFRIREATGGLAV